MRCVVVTVVQIFLAFAVGVVGQAPATALGEPYRFIDTGDLSKLRERLVQAGNEGYGVLSVARCPSRSHAGVIVKRDSAGARTYRLVETRRVSTFVKELNEAGAQGFRLVSGATQAFNAGNGDNWVAVLVQQQDGARFTYVEVRGDEERAKAIGESSTRGMALVAVLHERFIFEQALGASAAPAVERQQEYRIVTTSKTSTLETEIKQASAEGFRVLQRA